MQYFSGENRTGHSCCLPITIGIRSFPQTIKSQCAAGNKDVLKTDQRHLDIRNYHTSPCHIVKSSLIGMLLVTRNTAKHARKPTNKIPRLHVHHVHTCCWQNSPLFSKKTNRRPRDFDPDHLRQLHLSCHASRSRTFI